AAVTVAIEATPSCLDSLSTAKLARSKIARFSFKPTSAGASPGQTSFWEASMMPRSSQPQAGDGLGLPTTQDVALVPPATGVIADRNAEQNRHLGLCCNRRWDCRQLSPGWPARRRVWH